MATTQRLIKQVRMEQAWGIMDVGRSAKQLSKLLHCTEAQARAVIMSLAKMGLVVKCFPGSKRYIRTDFS